MCISLDKGDVLFQILFDMGKWVVMCIMKTVSTVEKKILSSYLDVISKNVNNRILFMFD